MRQTPTLARSSGARVRAGGRRDSANGARRRGVALVRNLQCAIDGCGDLDEQGLQRTATTRSSAARTCPVRASSAAFRAAAALADEGSPPLRESIRLARVVGVAWSNDGVALECAGGERLRTPACVLAVPRRRFERCASSRRCRATPKGSRSSNSELSRRSLCRSRCGRRHAAADAQLPVDAWRRRRGRAMAARAPLALARQRGHAPHRVADRRRGARRQRPSVVGAAARAPRGPRTISASLAATRRPRDQLDHLAAFQRRVELPSRRRAEGRRASPRRAAGQAEHRRRSHVATVFRDAPRRRRKRPAGGRRSFGF